MKLSASYPKAFEVIMGSAWLSASGYVEDDIENLYLCRNTAGSFDTSFTTTGYKYHKDNKLLFSGSSPSKGHILTTNTTDLGSSLSVDVRGFFSTSKGYVFSKDTLGNTGAFTFGKKHWRSECSLYKSSVLPPSGTYSFDVIRNHPTWLTGGSFSGIYPYLPYSLSSWDTIFKYQGPISFPEFSPAKCYQPPVRITLPANSIIGLPAGVTPGLFRVLLSDNTGVSNKDMTTLFDFISVDRIPCIAVCSDTAPLYTQCRVHVQNINTIDKIIELHILYPNFDPSVNTALYLYFDPSQPYNLEYVSIDDDALLMGTVGTPGQEGLLGYLRCCPGAKNSSLEDSNYGNKFLYMLPYSHMQEDIGMGSTVLIDFLPKGKDAYSPYIGDINNLNTSKLPGKATGLKFDGASFCIEQQSSTMTGCYNLASTYPAEDFALQLGWFITNTPTIETVLVNTYRYSTESVLEFPMEWYISALPPGDNSTNFKIKVNIHTVSNGVPNLILELTSTATYPINKYYQIGFTLTTNTTNTILQLLVNGVVVDSVSDTAWPTTAGGLIDTTLNTRDMNLLIGGKTDTRLAPQAGDTYTPGFFDYIAAYRGATQGSLTILQTLGMLTAMHNSDMWEFSDAIVINDVGSNVGVKDSRNNQDVLIQGVQYPGENYTQSTALISLPMRFQKIYTTGVTGNETPFISAKHLATIHIRLLVSDSTAILKVRLIYMDENGVLSYGEVITAQILDIVEDGLFHCEIIEFSTKGAEKVGIRIDSISAGTVDVWAATN